MEPTDGVDVQNATVHLFQQEAPVREQAPDELIDDYLDFLDEAGRTLVDTLQVTLTNRGDVLFRDLPLVHDTETPLIYSLQISEARTEVRDPDDLGMTRIVHFVEAAVPNLMAETGDPVTIQEIRLMPFDGFEVNSTGDAPDLDPEDGVCHTGELQSDGRPECTLRAALQQANAREGRDLISFNIPGPPPHIIAPLSKLPSIKDAVLIDGGTQPGFEPVVAVSGPPLRPGSPSRLMEARRAMSVGMQAGIPDNPKITLDGTNAGPNHGYLVKAMNVGIRGKRIVNFEGAGIFLTKKSGKVRITGNFIGVGQDGKPQENNFGILVQSSKNTIGGITQIPGKAPGNVISGNKRHGVLIEGLGGPTGGPTGNRVLGNIVGLDPSGTNPLGNTESGIIITDGSDNMIGGASAGAGNVISGNQFGVDIETKNTARNTVAGNIIGLDKTGTKALGNESNGVSIFRTPGNVIGGTQAGAGNVISGNGLIGISITEQEAAGNMVVGNLIGFDKAGTTTLGNGGNSALDRDGHGIRIRSAPGTIITSNHIGGNSGHGVWIGAAPSAKGARKTILQGNRIGESPSGRQFPNGENGVFVTDSAKNNTIGGIEPGDGNIITSGDQSAVVIKSGKRNTILANTITMASPEMGTIAIDLGDDGVTLNDIDGANTDADKGPNKLQNFPAIFQAKVERGDLEVTGTLFSKPLDGYTIRVFTCDGNPGTSFTFVGSLGGVNTEADGKGDFTFTDGNTQVQPGGFVAATATDSKGNTSEFSVPCVPVR